MFDWDVVIVGGGPAGLTAGLYLSRAKHRVLLLDKEAFGGQIRNVELIENYPGFPEGVGGAALAQQMQMHAEKYGAVFQFETATEVDFQTYPFRIKTRQNQFTAKAVIITTGSSPRTLGVPGEDKLRGHGVSYCATCDGWFFKDKVVAVVGGGDWALEEGVFLTRFAKKVHRKSSINKY